MRNVYGCKAAIVRQANGIKGYFVLLSIQADVYPKNTVRNGVWLNGDHPGCAKVHNREQCMVPHIGSNVQEDPATKRVFNDLKFFLFIKSLMQVLSLYYVLLIYDKKINFASVNGASNNLAISNTLLIVRFVSHWIKADDVVAAQSHSPLEQVSKWGVEHRDGSFRRS